MGLDDWHVPSSLQYVFLVIQILVSEKCKYLLNFDMDFLIFAASVLGSGRIRQQEGVPGDNSYSEQKHQGGPARRRQGAQGVSVAAR
jgi:hypothetical protein